MENNIKVKNLYDLSEKTEKVTLSEIIEHAAGILKENRSEKIIEGKLKIVNCKEKVMNLDIRITEG